METCGPPPIAAVEKLGLKNVLTSLGAVPSDQRRSIYVAYYRRDGG